LSASEHVEPSKRQDFCSSQAHRPTPTGINGIAAIPPKLARCQANP
jgi:hypothetical protein